MTAEEVSTRYKIPKKIMDEYQSWGLCDAVRMTMADWQYDDRDLERLGMILALHDMGFASSEVESYMNLLLQGPTGDAARLKMLEQKRSSTLDEIHLKERQLSRMDYLRHEIKHSK